MTTTNTSKHEAIIKGVMYAVLLAAGLFVAGNVVWWSFANTETIVGGLLVSALLLVPTAALYSLIATPVAALLGMLGGVVALVINRRA